VRHAAAGFSGRSAGADDQQIGATVLQDGKRFRDAALNGSAIAKQKHSVREFTLQMASAPRYRTGEPAFSLYDNASRVTLEAERRVTDGIPRAPLYSRKERPMLWTIFAILLILWLLGMVTSYTLGGFIHILLVLAIVAVLIRIIQGRTPVA
jgi:uncharacterized protein DUF5670